MRRKNREKKIKHKTSLVVYFVLLVIVSVVVGLLTVWYKISNLEKFTYVEKTSDNGAFITVVDSKADKSIRYKINSETVMNSARGLGEYRLESLWILGDKEGYGGKLVSESIISNYLIPVYLWKNDKKSNLSFYQKIKVRMISGQNIGDSYDLKGKDLPSSILINFIDNNIQESEIRVFVDDMTGDPEVMARVSSIIGTMGTKVSGYSKGYDENLDCEMYGSDLDKLEVFSSVFGCKYLNQADGGEVKIRLGAKFAERF